MQFPFHLRTLKFGLLFKPTYNFFHKFHSNKCYLTPSNMKQMLIWNFWNFWVWKKNKVRCLEFTGTSCYRIGTSIGGIPEYNNSTIIFAKIGKIGPSSWEEIGGNFSFHRQTDRQTDRQMDGQTDRQTERQRNAITTVCNVEHYKLIKSFQSSVIQRQV